MDQQVGEQAFHPHAKPPLRAAYLAAAEAARGEPLVAIRLLSEVVQVAPHSTLPLLGRG